MTEIEETVERVARAIGIKMGDYGPDTGWLGPQTHAMGLDIARAAIAAMPSPWRPEQEAVAKIIYDAFPFDGGREGHPKPQWVPGGNSVRQDDARYAASLILSLPSRPTGGLK